MRITLVTVGAAILLSGCQQDPPIQEKPAIKLQQLQTMFAQMKANTSWNVDGPMLWGYFFTSHNPENLGVVARRLKEQGFRVVDIHPAGDGLFVLHVEKVEQHTPESLDARDREFYQIAKQYNLDSYDGMDVGPAS